MNLELRIVQTIDDLIRAHAVRAIVFCSGQHVAYALEHDTHDVSCMHILGTIAGEPAVAGRLRFVHEYAKLERIAVRRRFRGNGFGHRLTDFMVATAGKLGFSHCRLHAQAHLQDFYAGHGFHVVGKPFAEAGIPHVLMVRQAK